MKVTGLVPQVAKSYTVPLKSQGSGCFNRCISEFSRVVPDFTPVNKGNVIGRLSRGQDCCGGKFASFLVVAGLLEAAC